MNKAYTLVLLLALLLSLNACQTFSPPYEIQTHKLIDKVWSASEQQFISKEALQQKTLTAQVILLGETHDNARHHQLQAQFISYLTENNQPPAVAFEMLNQNQQSIINSFEANQYASDGNSHFGSTRSGEKNTQLFADKINWQESGWPEWPYYHPVFYQTINNKLPIIAANLDLKQIRKVIKEGSQTLSQEYQDLLNKYQYDEALKKELEQEVQSAHCDMLPEKMLSPMLLGQQTRDIAMTQAIQSTLLKYNTATKAQIVLIAGSGHTRTDYGIPFYLQQENPELRLISIAFVEVSEDEFKPDDYAKAWSKTATQLPFDYVWFTARAEREDQCEKMKEHMNRRIKNKE
ncbi:MAG: ChaN family lipoprotein [gamma proteobacterium symbiont of Bathyaustriella thionipta]|nr:ChaN family lipoprotein [gamma proteobacterium symbiont of Bathyaustriella thionipta]MCU7951482.1 ChaN family lipoprotein [gamma proteobacterium symbiont of Bathyaustriella thionipta]MCU7954291.1 ChaN family lipoprotein [gamma proteobacterium symbiont of Bathyaustriella thionipta]MCU7956735.1 ChaN family lipoprotein [gamma proteobacterium symbiont of Bathyaustriella thionipta]MCU7968745.1 ChaN family lipoprotein [gamma proteobacterium symbiont of Bathyaustriella thionipta]